MKVEQLANKNQFIIYGEDGIYFQSYESLIARINQNGVLELSEYWNFSNTTLRHLYMFLFKFKGLLNSRTKQIVNELETKNNKKTYLQKMLDKKIIKKMQI